MQAWKLKNPGGAGHLGTISQSWLRLLHMFSLSMREMFCKGHNSVIVRIDVQAITVCLTYSHTSAVILVPSIHGSLHLHADFVPWSPLVFPLLVFNSLYPKMCCLQIEREHSMFIVLFLITILKLFNELGAIWLKNK